VSKIRREDAWRLLILAAVWTALFLAIDPRGQFPLNDDFQYAECARRWLAGGGLRLPEWALSSTITHALLGAVATAPWGAANQALRMWMLVLGLAGAALVYALARRWRAGEDAALLASLTLAVSPLYAAMSASFHLDITVVVFTSAGLLAFLHARESGEKRWLAASSLLIALSGLARQTGFLCVAGGAAALALDGKLTKKAAAALLLPAAIAAMGFWAWFHFIHGPTWAWQSGKFSPNLSLQHWTRPDVWRTLFGSVVKTVQTVSLFLFPLAVLRWKDAARRPARGECAVLFLSSAAALILWARAGGLPLIQNTLSHLGLGVVTLLGSDDKPAGWWGNPWLWNAAAFLALVSSVVLFQSASSALRAQKSGEARAAFLFIAAPFCAVLLMPGMYDRYILALLPAAAAACAAGRKEKARSLIPAFAAAALLGAFTWAGLSDYFAWNRARWSAGMDAVARGVPPEKIENGFDWDGQFSLTRNLAALRRDRAPADIGMWDWQKLNKIVLETTFSEKPTEAGWILVASYPYKTPLVPGGGVVRVFALPALLKPRSVPSERL
jgi:4-amino-4-deoxy-L-arabinose transferase-like glycosyltransferase